MTNAGIKKLAKYLAEIGCPTDDCTKAAAILESLAAHEAILQDNATGWPMAKMPILEVVAMLGVIMEGRKP